MLGMTASSITISRAADDIGLLTIDTPGQRVNLLSPEFMRELGRALDELAAQPGLVGLIIISGKPGHFCAGADLQLMLQRVESATPQQVLESCVGVQAVLAKLAAMPFVTVAAIDGACLGGGAELASWCDRRVTTDRAETEIGFPEVKLGLIPGWGGVARLPRLIGLGPAIEWITSGEARKANDAVRSGWASAIVPPDQLVHAAVALIRDESERRAYVDDRRRWALPLAMSTDERELLRTAALQAIRRHVHGRNAAPEAALDALLESAAGDALAGGRLSAERLSRLFGSPVHRGLLNVYFLQDRVKREAGAARNSPDARTIGRVGVIGAGIMGAGIAGAHLRRDVPVTLADSSAAALAKGRQQAIDDASYDRKLHGVDPQRALRASSLLTDAPALDRMSDCGLVIEAIVENADAKRQIFDVVEPQLHPDAVLASNTSTIRITNLAARLARPDRFCGMHFFNPVKRMPLVEIIRGRQTSDATILTAVAHAQRIGKSPIVVNDGPGFLVNRLLFPYLNESLELLGEGADPWAIERAATDFGMPLGPLELYDMVGLDTAMYAGRVILEAFPDRVKPSPILPMLVKSGRLGQKSGAGFFQYGNPDRKPQTDPAALAIIQRYRTADRQHSPEELTWRLLLPMLLEATRALEDDVVRDPRDIDFGVIFGLGFPAWRGGLLFWAKSLGLDEIQRQLEPFESFGPRMRPTNTLRTLLADRSAER